MAYRHPNEIKENQQLMEKCMHDAVECALNEIMPTVMGEMESVLDQKMETLRTSIVGSMVPKVDDSGCSKNEPSEFTKGLWVGAVIGVCLFVGLVTGILVSNIL